MQNGKFGSYVCARAGPVAETDTIANIAKAKRRIETFLTIDRTASARATRPARGSAVKSRLLADVSRDNYPRADAIPPRPR